MSRYLIAVALTVLSMFAATSSAFAATEKLECTFYRQHSPDEEKIQTSEMEFEIFVDTIEKKAFIAGNGGIQQLVMHTGSGGRSFLEILSSGAVQIITIDLFGRAVYSRQTIIIDEIVPSQHYGICR